MKNEKTDTTSFCWRPVHCPLANPLPDVVEPNPAGCWTFTFTEYPAPALQLSVTSTLIWNDEMNLAFWVIFTLVGPELPPYPA